MELALYLSSLGFHGVWFSAGADQLDQAKKYMKYIINCSYLKYLIIPGLLLKESVVFLNGGELKLKNLTELKARSARGDFIIYDEEAMADEVAYNAGVNILRVSNLCFIFHISTAKKGSLFEKTKNRLKTREFKHNESFVFERPWYDIGFLAVQKEWYDEERERLRKEGREWEFRQEHECSFELPTGAVFKNVVYDVYDKDGNLKIPLILDDRIVSGLDWNPVAGHWLVGGQWSKNMNSFLVSHAFRMAIGYTHKLREQNYLDIKKYCTNRKRTCMEAGGINEEYVDWFKEWIGKDKNKRDMYVLYEEWDSMGVNKTNAALSMESVTIYVDRVLFPKLAIQIEECHWKPNSTKAEVNKDPIDSPHALDGFLHAINGRLLKDVGLRRFDWHG